MLRVNLANFLTIGLIAAVFVVAINFGFKKMGVNFNV